MSDELAIIEQTGLTIARTPQIVLDEARDAARALKGVIDAKKRKVIISGRTYLEFEDWQTVGRFYGIAPQIISTKPMEFGEAHGWEAIAHAVHVPTGRVVASAEAMCMSDEPRWGSRPQFQLRSMAQTRAGAKALRNALAWVVVLAGYAGTPAEEVQDEHPALPEKDDFTVPSETAAPSEADRQFYILKMTENGKRDKLTLAEKRALMEAAFGSVNADVTTVPIEKLHNLYVSWNDLVSNMRKT